MDQIDLWSFLKKEGRKERTKKRRKEKERKKKQKQTDPSTLQ